MWSITYCLKYSSFSLCEIFQLVSMSLGIPLILVLSFFFFFSLCISVYEISIDRLTDSFLFCVWSTGYMRMCSVTQLFLTLCYLMDCSPPGFSFHGILQARILEWVALPSFKGSSWPRDQTHVSCVSCIDRWILNHWSLLNLQCFWFLTFLLILH